MAEHSSSYHFDSTQQTPDNGALASFVRHFRSADPCRTAADVRARAALVRARRLRAWPQRWPSRPIRLPVAPLPAPSPKPTKPAPVLAIGRVSVRAVLAETAAHFGRPISELISQSRSQPLCRQRHIAMYLARTLTKSSLPFIAHLMGRRDRTTVLHGARIIEHLVNSGDQETVSAVKAITAKLDGGAA